MSAPEYPIAANGAMVDTASIARFMGALFGNVDWNGEVVSLLGIGEKGTDREGSFRERKFVTAGAVAEVAKHAKRWAEHHAAAFLVPCVVSPSAVIAGDVTLERIAAMTAIILDLDSGDVPAKQAFVTARLGLPSIVVRSGGKTEEGHEKRHLYWIFNEPEAEVEQVAAIRKLLAIKSGGDPSFGRATQVIRIPGTVHAKHGNAALCELIECTDREYSFADLAETITGMLPMEGLPPAGLPTPTPAASNVLDFAAYAGMQSATDAMMRDIHEGSTEEANRWSTFNQVAGFNIQQVRLGNLTADEAFSVTKGWMLAHMVPPWPDARFQTEFRALWNHDIKEHGEMPVPALTIAAAEVAAGAIVAHPFEWRDASLIPPRPWIFGRWLLRNCVTAVVAPGGVGKSSLMSGLALALASGRSEVLGRDVIGGPKTVWLWNLEDDGDELARSLHAASHHHAIPPHSIQNRLFVNSGPDGDGLCTAVEDRTGFKLLKPIYEAVIAELLARCVDVLIVDPFVSSHQVSENDNGSIDAVVKEWARVAKAARCAILLVHHSKKLSGERVTSESSRGATSLTNAARSVLVLNRMTPDEGRHWGIDEEHCTRYFSVNDDKHNRAPAEHAAWFHLAGQDLGNGDSVGVVTKWTPPPPMAGFTWDQVRQMQRVIDLADRDNPYGYDSRARPAAWEALSKVSTIKDQFRCQGLIEWLARQGYLEVEDWKKPGKAETKRVVRKGSDVPEVGAPGEVQHQGE